MIVLHICQHCNTEFNGRKDSPNIFCSKSCNASYHNKLRAKPKLPDSLCLTCDTPTYKPNKFCCRSCAAIHNNASKKGVSKLPPKLCAHCSAPVNNRERKFCSKECGWNHKKKHYDREIILARKRETYKRYMARRKYQTPIGEDIKAMQLFYYNCPPGYEVDHIIPLSKGGPHSLENLQYLTREENRRKSNKILEAGVGFEPTTFRV